MMATSYPSLSSQSDNLQSPYPGDEKLASYSALTSHHGNIAIFVNQGSAGGSYSEILSGSSLSTHNCSEFQSVGARNEMVFITPTSDTMNLQCIDGQLDTAAGNLVGNNSVSGDNQVAPRMQLGVLDREQNFQSQGLSLTLGTQVQSTVSIPSFQYQYPNLTFPSLLSTHLPTLGNGTLSCESDESNQSKELRSFERLTSFAKSNHYPMKTEASSNTQCLVSQKDMHTDMYAYEPSGYANIVLNSKYLKAVQHLLDEVANVKGALKQPESNKCLDDSKETDGRPSSRSMPSIAYGMSSNPSESITNSSSELSHAERQDLQNKETKLMSMLDEVDKKYKQYYHQMQVVVSSFDMVAGYGAAKSYTALALQAISRHFRCLRDAISGQIEVTRKRLGEQDTSLNSQGGIPRPRYVDHQVRQQRAFQHLAVMRHAWRPQRGLPESSVSILRAWLFEHFLHPYPNDSEKIMLARQTGLTRNQVANWFINARVRLWKPMVEEMYKEEFGDLEANSKSSLDDAPKTCGENHLASANGLDELQDTVTSTASDSSQPGQVDDLKPNHIPNSEMKKPIAGTMFQHGSHGHNVKYSGIMAFQHDERSNMDGHSLYPDENIQYDQNGDGSLMPAAITYDASELSGFAVGGQVSLALGLQHHESDAFLISGGIHIRDNTVAASAAGPDTVDYHCMDPGKQQERFGNSHTLRDFVV